MYEILQLIEHVVEQWGSALQRFSWVSPPLSRFFLPPMQKWSEEPWVLARPGRKMANSWPNSVFMVRAIVIFLINASPSRVWNQKTLSGSQTSTEETHLFCYSMQIYISSVTSSPDHSQILSSSYGEKSGEGLGSKLRHRPEMVDSVSTNRVHHFRSVT